MVRPWDLSDGMTQRAVERKPTTLTSCNIRLKKSKFSCTHVIHVIIEVIILTDSREVKLA
jgi:hypothetical protein